jgi:hypothetical protein
MLFLFLLNQIKPKTGKTNFCSPEFERPKCPSDSYDGAIYDFVGLSKTRV